MKRRITKALIHLLLRWHGWRRWERVNGTLGWQRRPRGGKVAETVRCGTRYAMQETMREVLDA